MTDSSGPAGTGDTSDPGGAVKLDKKPPTPRRPRWSWLRVTGSVGPFGIGVAVLWLSIIVLLPLAALTVSSFEDGWSGFWDAVTAPSALDSLKVTIGVSVIVAVIRGT